MEIGAHHQSGSIVPVSAVHDTQLSRVVCDEGVHGRGDIEDNRRVYIAPIPEDTVLVVYNLLLTSFRHFHPLLLKLGVTIIVGIRHCQVNHHSNFFV